MSDLQNEIKKLSTKFYFENNIDEVQVISNELEQKIKDISYSSSWNQYKILVNKFLKDYGKFTAALAKNNIPIHGTIGSVGLELNDPPEILIGSGFTLLHIKEFLNSIKSLPISIIGYAFPEDGDNYHKEILLGAYNNSKGLSLNNAIMIINTENIDIETFYSEIQIS